MQSMPHQPADDDDDDDVCTSEVLLWRKDSENLKFLSLQ